MNLGEVRQIQIPIPKVDGIFSVEDFFLFGGDVTAPRTQAANQWLN